MKRFLIVLLVVLFVLSASGCGRPNESPKVKVIFPNIETKIPYSEELQKGDVIYKRVPLNIYGSKISAFALSYDNPKRAYVALANGEIYKTEDLGKTWEKIAKITPKNAPASNNNFNIVSIAEGDSGRVLYVATNHSIFKSENYGKTFKEIWNSLEKDLSTTSIIVSKDNPNLIVINDSTGEYLLSSDGGISFTPFAKDFSLIRYNYATNELFATNRKALFRSRDFGKTWEKLAGDLNEIDNISVSQSDHPVIIISTYDNSGQSKELITKDYGRSFSEIATPPQILPLVIVSPANPNFIVFVPVYTNTFSNSKIFFLNGTDSKLKEIPIYETVASAQFTIDGSNMLILTNSNILYRWDLNNTFEFENAFPEVYFKDIVSYNGVGYILTNGAAFKVNFATGHLALINKDDLNPLVHIAILEQDASTGYAYSYARLFSLAETSLKPIKNIDFIHRIVVNPLDPKNFFIEKSSEDGMKWVLVSYDGGENFETLSPSNERINIKSVSFDTINPSTLYAVGEDTSQEKTVLMKSDDSGKTWKTLSEIPIQIINEIFGNIEITINVFNSSIYIYGAASIIFKSDDYGKTLKVFNKGINKIQNAPIRSLLFNPKTKDLFLLTDSNGLFMCKNGSDTWVDISGEFPKDKISALSIDKKTGKIYVGVDSVGLFEVIP